MSAPRRRTDKEHVKASHAFLLRFPRVSFKHADGRWRINVSSHTVAVRKLGLHRHFLFASIGPRLMRRMRNS